MQTVCDSITGRKAENEVLDVIYSDFSKAFDTISLDIVLCKSGKYSK